MEFNISITCIQFSLSLWFKIQRLSLNLRSLKRLLSFRLSRSDPFFCIGFLEGKVQEEDRRQEEEESRESNWFHDWTSVRIPLVASSSSFSLHTITFFFGGTLKQECWGLNARCFFEESFIIGSVAFEQAKSRTGKLDLAYSSLSAGIKSILGSIESGASIYNCKIMHLSVSCKKSSWV